MNLLDALLVLAPNERIPFELTTPEKELEVTYHFVHEEKDKKGQATLRRLLVRTDC